jgi:hypothetical protein
VRAADDLAEADRMGRCRRALNGSVCLAVPSSPARIWRSNSVRLDRDHRKGVIRHICRGRDRERDRAARVWPVATVNYHVAWVLNAPGACHAGGSAGPAVDAIERDDARAPQRAAPRTFPLPARYGQASGELRADCGQDGRPVLDAALVREEQLTSHGDARSVDVLSISR